MNPTDPTTPMRSETASDAPVLSLVALTCLTLLATAAVHLMFVIPVFRQLLQGLGTSFSAPARLAIGIGSFGALLVVLGVAALIALYIRGRKGSSQRGQFAVVLSLSGVALAVYVSLVSWAYVDVARKLPYNVRCQVGAPGAVQPN